MTIILGLSPILASVMLVARRIMVVKEGPQAPDGGAM